MVTINLIPEAIQGAQSRRRHAARWAALIVVAMLCTAIPTVTHWRQHSRVEELRVINGHLQTDLVAARAELKRVSSEAADLLLRSERARALREKRSWSSMLALIASCLPAECRLTSLTTDPAAPGVASGGQGTRKPPAAAPSPPPVAPAAGASPAKGTPVTVEAPRILRLQGNARQPTQPLEFVAALKDAHVFRDVVLEHAASEGDQRSPQFRFEVRCEW